MNRGHRVKPQAKHWALYSQTPYEELPLTSGQQRGRMAGIAFAVVVVALLVPFVPSRHRHSHIPATLEEYARMLVGGSVIALLIGLLWWYEYLLKPMRNHKRGYRLVGQFEVRGKQRVFGSAWLELAPDDTHRVGVPEEVFDALHKGDTVEVVYSASEDFISVRKIMPTAASA